MRQFQTSVLELRETISAGYTTQPFECAWATEAIFFVHTDEAADSDLTAHAQISPDGIRWLDEGSVLHVPATDQGSFVRLGNFGGWLRLRFDGEGATRMTIRLALKE